jgi:hypothetical protein
MEEKYNVYDLRLNPSELVVETINFTEEQCIDWISVNGDATIYTIIKI